jgi:uncharacterized protein (TIGR03382 family)
VNRAALAAAAALVTVTASAGAGHRPACTNPGRHCLAQILTDDSGKDVVAGTGSCPTPPPNGENGYTPSDLQQAYGIDPTLNPGATIAVIDAFGYPTLEADLTNYRACFGLPPCTSASGCLTILNQNGQTTPLPAAGSSNDAQGWQAEAALDLDMASSACPNCKLIAVEANDDGDDGLDVANDAAAMAGATVISNSWGAPESQFNPISTFDAHYTHPGIAIFASTGDNGNAGAGEGFPSTSEHVIAVGGTSLDLDAASPRGFSESAWSGAGSVCSKAFTKPFYQPGSACKMRATGDVSAIADPNTGADVFEQGGWGVIGGTSAASPLVAGIFAATGHGSATPQYPYANTSQFNDITTGTNGSCDNEMCKAGPGWDGPTGIGTPIAALMAGHKLPTFAMSPGPNTKVPPGFEVLATCVPKDDATVTEVDIGVDGVEFAALHAPPYVKAMPPSLAMGDHLAFATCKLSSLVVTGGLVTVNIVAPCTDDSSCTTDGDLCFEGACIPGPDLADGLGRACSANTQCTSAMCGGSGAPEECVTLCDAAGACPTGFSCDTASDLCTGPVHGNGGGCNTGGDAPVAPLALGGLAVALVVLRRRA